MNGWQRRLVTIQQPSSSIDENTGAEEITWLPLVPTDESPDLGEKFWAEVRDVRPGREATTNGLTLAKNRAECRIRWREDVTAAMRVTVHGDTDVVYSIIGGPSEVGGRKKGIEMLLERASS